MWQQYQRDNNLNVTQTTRVNKLHVLIKYVASVKNVRLIYVLKSF